MDIESRYKIKILLICAFGAYFTMFMTIYFRSGINLEYISHIYETAPNKVADVIIFYFTVMILFYGRLKRKSFCVKLDTLVYYGAIYGYMSSVLSYIYSEMFFFLKPFSLLGFNKATHYVMRLFSRSSLEEFFIGFLLLH